MSSLISNSNGKMILSLEIVSCSKTHYTKIVIEFSISIIHEGVNGDQFWQNASNYATKQMILMTVE
jgi:hypothetical protein